MKKLKGILLAFGLTLLFSSQVLAAGNAKIQFNDPTITRGKKVTVSMKIKSSDINMSGADITFFYDQNILSYVSGTDAEGGAGTIRVKGAGKGNNKRSLEYDIVFDTLTAGTAYISIATGEVYDANNALVNVTHFGTSKITIRSAKTTSKNANLKSITPSVGEIEPAFSKDVLNYSVTVGEDTNSLPISALAEDVDAKVAVSGNTALVVGENKVTIRVTAPNGSTKKTYNLTVNKVNGMLSSIKAAGSDVQAIRSSDMSVTILPLPDGDGPDGFITSTTKFEGKEISVLLRDGYESSGYFVFYGRSSDGEMGYYRYDTKEKTVQRYFDEPAISELAKTRKDYQTAFAQFNAAESARQRLFYIVIALGAACLILLIATIIFARKSSKKGMEYLDEYEEGMDEDDEDDDRYFSRRNRDGADYGDDYIDERDGYYEEDDREPRNDRYERGSRVLDDLHRRREEGSNIEDLE